MRTRFLVAGAVLALVAVACGGGDDEERSSPTTTSASAPTTTVGTSTGLKVGDRVTSSGTQLEAP